MAWFSETQELLSRLDLPLSPPAHTPQGHTCALETADGPSEVQLETPDVLDGPLMASGWEGAHLPVNLRATVLPLMGPGVTEGQRWHVTPRRHPGLPSGGGGGEPEGPSRAGRGVPPCLSVKNKIIIIMFKMKSSLWLEGESNIFILKSL